MASVIVNTMYLLNKGISPRYHEAYMRGVLLMSPLAVDAVLYGESVLVCTEHYCPTVPTLVVDNGPVLDGESSDGDAA